MSKSQTEILLNQWLTNGDYLRIAKKTKSWSLGLMKGFPADDLGQIVALALVLKAKRQGSCYNPEKGSVSNYLWLVANSSILSAVGKASILQAGEELDLTKYDVERADDYQTFKNGLLDGKTEEMSNEKLLIEEIKKELTKEISVNNMSAAVGNIVCLLLDGKSTKGNKTVDKKAAEIWLKEYLKRE